MNENSQTSSCSRCGAPLTSDALKGLCPRCLMALNLKTETVFTDDTPAAQPPLPSEQIAPHFPQLQVLECLGRGGMGVVYKARQKSLNRLVALKLLAPERVGDAKFAERFTREAQALAALNHPNIVTIHDFGQAGGYYFLLMEFVDGLNLRQLLRTRKFTPEEALAIVPPLCDALQFAHNRGIVHRDIKPENLLLDKDGRVKVADFGIAKMLGTANGGGTMGESAVPESSTQSTLGTPGYSAPEQKTDPQRVDSRADIYSLGVVFYELLTGELPGKPLQPPSRKVQIDVRLDEVVLRALEMKPELRYQQASEVKTCVETIVATPLPGGSRAEEVHAQSEGQRAEGGSQSQRFLASSSPTPGRSGWWRRHLLPDDTAARWAQLICFGVALVVLVMGILKLATLELRPHELLFGAVLVLILSVVMVVLGLLAGSARAPSSPGAAGSAVPTRDVPKVIPVAAKVGFAWIVLFFSILGWFGVGAFLGNDLKSTLREIPILQFGFVTAVVSTVCGWLAVHKTRKSRGKLGGLGLALFDGLVFPLLILDALLAFLIIVAVPGARDTLMDSFQVGFGGPRTGPVLAELASIAAVLLVVDFLVVRAVWRAMNRHIRSGAGSNLNTPGRPAQAGAAAWGIATAGAVLLLLAAWGSWTRKAAEAKGQWQPQEVKWIPVPAQGALARICITNVLRYGRIAIFELVSKAGFPEHMITVRYEGPGLESYPPAYTEPALTGLLIPWPVGADATNTPVFTGRNIGRGPGTFRFGFALPNEHAAELVVNQARGLYLGKTNHLGEAANVLLLFQLTRPAPEAGDGRGKWQVLTGTLSVSAVPAWESTATFGPVIERVVVPKMALDLDTGKAATYEPQWRWVHDPVSSRRSRVPLQPMRSQGLDIWLDEDWALLSADTGLRAMSNEDWDAISPSQLIKTLELINRGGSDPTELRVGTNGPVTCGFQTREGGQGLLQLAGFTENPRGVKMRYKLVQTKPAASTGSGKPEGSQRKFVRLVVDNAAMTFEGQPTTWDAVGALLEKVPERKNTVLEFAVTSDQITVQQQNEWFGKCIALAHGLGFEYASLIGIHALGSKGTTPSTVPTEAGPLSGTLPGGVNIQLVGLTDDPTEGRPSWQPDGQPFQAPLFDASDVDVRSRQLRGERIVELALAISGLKSGNACDAALALPHRSFWAGKKLRNGSVQSSIIAVGLIVPTNATVAHITVSLGANGRLGLAREMFPSAAAAAEGSPPLPVEGGPGITFKNVSIQTGYATRPEVQTAH